MGMTPGRTFRLVFCGELVPGRNRLEVMERVATLHATTVGGVAAFFSGRPEVVRRGLDAKGAEQARAAYEQAGARVTIEPEEEPPASTAAGDRHGTARARLPAPVAPRPAAKLGHLTNEARAPTRQPPPSRRAWRSFARSCIGNGDVAPLARELVGSLLASLSRHGVPPRTVSLLLRAAVVAAALAMLLLGLALVQATFTAPARRRPPEPTPQSSPAASADRTHLDPEAFGWAWSVESVLYHRGPTRIQDVENLLRYVGHLAGAIDVEIDRDRQVERVPPWRDFDLATLGHAARQLAALHKRILASLVVWGPNSSLVPRRQEWERLRTAVFRPSAQFGRSTHVLDGAQLVLDPSNSSDLWEIISDLENFATSSRARFALFQAELNAASVSDEQISDRIHEWSKQADTALENKRYRTDLGYMNNGMPHPVLTPREQPYATPEASYDELDLSTFPAARWEARRSQGPQPLCLAYQAIDRARNYLSHIKLWISPRPIGGFQSGISSCDSALKELSSARQNLSELDL